MEKSASLRYPLKIRIYHNRGTLGEAFIEEYSPLLSGLGDGRTWSDFRQVSAHGDLLSIRALAVFAVPGQPLSRSGFRPARQMGGVFIEAPLMLFSIKPDMPARTCNGDAWTLE